MLWPLDACRAQAQKFTTLGYRSCGTGQGNCHQMDGDWWKSDPHYNTVTDLKRKQQKSMEIARAYGMAAADYLKGNSVCAQCHGEVVAGREQSNMNTGVSCESCHGPAGPKGIGYFEVHQEGANPRDPLDTSRSGYRKALQAGMLELRDVNTRARVCVACHQINEKKLLEAGHPSGEGFDYVRGIRNNISRHWDYRLRPADSDEQPYLAAVRSKPIPRFVARSADPPSTADATPAPEVTPKAGERPAAATPQPANRRSADRAATPRPVRRVIAPAPEPVIIRVDPELPAWLNPKSTIALQPFNPQLSADAPADSILLPIKQYIEYVHQTINRK